MNEFEKKVIGYEPIVAQLTQICDMMQNEEAYTNLGATIPRGIMLYGAPGLGKSLMATCFCKESGRKVYTLRRSKKSDNFADEISEVFCEAKKNAPSVVFLDDLDHFCPTDVDDEEFIIIQSEIDEIGEKDVVVIATVNNMRRLPPSLRRSGRFDRCIHVPAPEVKDAEKIIKYYLKDKKVDSDINCGDISKMLVGASCSDISEILNEAAIYAGTDRKDKISMNYFVKAALLSRYDSVDGYDEITPEEKSATATHEAGHLVCAEICQPGVIGMASILVSGRGELGGFVSRCAKFKRRPYDVVTCLGGKAAVELYMPGCASGAQSDLHKAMDIIRDGVVNSGTLGLGNLDAANEQFPKTSDGFKDRNESVVLSELERNMFVAKKILIENRDFLEKVRDALIEKGTLLYSDIQAIKETCTITPINM